VTSRPEIRRSTWSAGHSARLGVGLDGLGGVEGKASGHVELDFAVGQDVCPGQGPRRLSDPHQPRQGRQGPLRPIPRRVQRDPRATYRLAASRRRRPPVRVVLEEALQRPGRAQDPGALRHRRRHRGPDQPPTDFATSCSPGSRPRGSTTPSSSPTPATPPANRWRSTPGSRSPTPGTPTTRRSSATPSKPRTRLRLVTRFLPAPPVAPFMR
jgi:hypothetical protein